MERCYGGQNQFLRISSRPSACMPAMFGFARAVVPIAALSSGPDANGWFDLG